MHVEHPRRPSQIDLTYAAIPTHIGNHTRLLVNTGRIAACRLTIALSARSASAEA